MNSKTQLPDRTSLPAANSLSRRALQMARRSASRMRLSYLLLDVFLGGFIVGIVLMITLGRPPEENNSDGAGGEEFMLIELDWNNPDLIFNPVLKFNGEHVHPYGLSSPLAIDRKSVWARYEVKDGRLNNGDILRRFNSLTMDGFYVDSKRAISPSDKPKKQYGYLLLSRPCPGTWSLGMRIIDESSVGKDSQGYTVRYRSVCSGYENTNNCNPEWQILIASNNVNTAGDPFAEMGIEPASPNRVVDISVKDDKKKFGYCGGV